MKEPHVKVNVGCDVCFSHMRVLQVKMLQALGLKSTLITDGSSPINLFTTASGLLGALPGQ